MKDTLFKMGFILLIEIAILFFTNFINVHVSRINERDIQNNSEEYFSYGKKVKVIERYFPLNYITISITLAIITAIVFGFCNWQELVINKNILNYFLVILEIFGYYIVLAILLVVFSSLGEKIKIKYLKYQFNKLYGIKII